MTDCPSIEFPYEMEHNPWGISGYVSEAVITKVLLSARPKDGKEVLAAAAKEIVEDATPGIIEQVTPLIEAKMMLARALERRFGHMPNELKLRISEADERDVERWMASTQRADSLDQIFNGSDRD